MHKLGCLLGMHKYGRRRSTWKTGEITVVQALSVCACCGKSVDLGVEELIYDD